MNKEIYLAGGCFWGVEKYFAGIKGVTGTNAGYANGAAENPSYQEVCGGAGHAETVRVLYDSAVVSLDKLLALYYEIIDPTSVNRQGGDSGIQYRTGIYYVDKDDEETIKNSLAKLQMKHDRPLAVEACALENYYPAEEYHQKYLDKNPGGYCHISPEKFAN